MRGDTYKQPFRQQTNARPRLNFQFSSARDPSRRRFRTLRPSHRVILERSEGSRWERSVKNVLLEDDTGGECEALSDASGGANSSHTDEIEIVCSVNHQKRDDYPYRFRYKFYVSVTDGCATVSDTTSDDRWSPLQSNNKARH